MVGLHKGYSTWGAFVWLLICSKIKAEEEYRRVLYRCIANPQVARHRKLPWGRHAEERAGVREQHADECLVWFTAHPPWRGSSSCGE